MGFYGSPYGNNRSDSWEDLQGLGSNNTLSWCVCGDFNEIMYAFEKKCVLLRYESRMELFHKAFMECGIIDMRYLSSCFTWKREILPENNIHERLDCGVMNEKWLARFPKALVRHLPHSILDHCPLLVQLNDETKLRGNRIFKFEAWWTIEDSFEIKVEKSRTRLGGQFL